MVDWIHINKTTGPSGTTIVSVTADENETYTARTATFTVKSGSKSQVVRINQVAKERPYITVGSIPEFDYTGGTINVDVESNVSWVVSENCPWIMVAPQRASSGKTSVQITADVNNGYDRECEICFVGDNVEKCVNVRQKWNAIYDLPVPNCNEIYFRTNDGNNIDELIIKNIELIFEEDKISSNNVLSIEYGDEYGIITCENCIERIPDGFLSVTQYDGWNNFITNISLPNTIKTIGEDVFRGSYGDFPTKIERLTLPENVEEIGRYFFWGNKDIKSVDLSNTKIETFGDETFFICSNLYELKLPNTLKSTGYRFCVGCNLSTIDLPESLEEIGDENFMTSKSSVEIFSQSGLESIVFPKNLKKIGSSFAHSSYLRNVFIPNNVWYIGNSFCSDCLELNSVEIESGNNFVTIGNNFLENTPITSIEIPENVIKVGRGFVKNSKVTLINCYPQASPFQYQDWKLVYYGVFNHPGNLTEWEEMYGYGKICKEITKDFYWNCQESIPSKNYIIVEYDGAQVIGTPTLSHEGDVYVLTLPGYNSSKPNFRIFTNVDINADSDSGFISCELEKDLWYYYLYVNVTENDMYEERSGYITINGGGVTVKIKIVQPGKEEEEKVPFDYGIFTITDVTVNNTKQTINSRVITEDDVTWNMSTIYDWISVDTSSHIGNGDFQINIEENTGLEERNGIVIFTFTRGHSETIEYKIKQKGVPVYENNVIYYTSTDGNIVEIDDAVKTGSFSVYPRTFVSNTYDDGIGKITFERDITKIPVELFKQSEMGRVKTIILPDTIQEIANNVCTFGYSYLEEINIPKSVKKIGNNFLSLYNDSYNKGTVVNITAPEDCELTEIGDSFLRRNNFKNLDFLKNTKIETIGEYFCQYGNINNNKPEDIVFPSTIKTVGANFLGYLGYPNGTMSGCTVDFSDILSLTFPQYTLRNCNINILKLPLSFRNSTYIVGSGGTINEVYYYSTGSATVNNIFNNADRKNMILHIKECDTGSYSGWKEVINDIEC